MRTIEHPYHGVHEATRWLRGNLHAHTTRSDGRLEPQALIDAYAVRGYDFLAVSDHDIFTGPDAYAAWDGRGMALLPANEISRDGVHLLHIDGDRRIEPEADRQKALDRVAATAGFIVVNHPNWYPDFNHCPQASLEAWRGYAGIEIFNGVIQRLEGSPYALDRWDRLLSTGRRIWGFVHDDAHLTGDIAQGWNQVAADERTPAGIVAALRAGRFYGSTGVRIDAIAVAGTLLAVRAREAKRIVAVTQHGRRLAYADAAQLVVDVAAQGEVYVRFECWGEGERFAWTQPFFLGPLE